MPSSNPLNVFISYAHEDHKYKEELLAHLSDLKRNKEIEVWNDGMIMPGDDWEEEIYHKLNQSDIIIFLVSRDLAKSDFIWKQEVPKAFERENKKECKVIPILVRPYSYEDSELAKKEMLPKKNGDIRSVEEWSSRDTAYVSVVTELKKVIEEIKGNRVESIKNTLVNPPNTSPLTLKDVWNNIPLKRGIPISDIHQINREAAFGKALKTLDDPTYNGHNLYYFITSCTTQSPYNLANRLFNYCYDVFDSYNYTANDFDNIPVYDFKIQRHPELTWKTFWRQFKENFDHRFLNLNADLKSGDAGYTEFVKDAPELMHPINRFPFFCKLVDNEWNNLIGMNIEEHLQYIVHQFSILPKGIHKFVFFFLIELKDLHNCHCIPDSRAAKRFHKIKTFCSSDYEYEIKPQLSLIELLDYVEESDLEDWFGKMINLKECKQTPNYYFRKILLPTLLNELDENEKLIYENHRAFNMDRMVIMQRFAYPFIK